MSKKNKIAIFLAARAGSKRLPKKHFLKLDSRLKVIDLCILRLKKAKLVKNIFLCTTKKKLDDKFKQISDQHKINLFRGSENNVLKRYIDCAYKNSIDTIVRITADCPIIDPKLIDRCIKLHFRKNSDYTSNILERSFPNGLDVEVVKLSALIKSKKISKRKDNLEHVTSFIRSSKLFKKHNFKNSINYSNRRWTLDCKKDYFFLKKVFKFFRSNPHFFWKDLIKAEKNNRYLLNIQNESVTKVQLKNRFIIGSTNFSQKYGIDDLKINLSEVKKILNFAHSNNINKIDTAESYLHDGSFFSYIKNRFKLITKVKPDHNWTSLSFCEQELKNQIKNLNNNKIQTLLFHDVKILFTNIGPKIFNNLEILKNKGYFRKIGISIYGTDCLKYLTSKYNFNVVQCPYNILDKRIVYSGWLNKLKKKGIEVHVRSIFLQGLLVNEKIYKKNYFKKWRNKISNWFDYLNKNGISPINYCLNDLLSHDFDQIIIGINSRDHLKEIFNFKLIENKDKMVDFTTKDLKLVDPRCWK